MSDQAPDAPAASDSMLVQFSAFDRKVSVLQSDENTEPSLYSLVRSWVLNGRPGVATGSENTSTPSVVLPASQTLPAEPLNYPPECFSKFYLGDNPSGELKNLPNVYKSAWVTAHTYYSHHKLRRRRRHAQRHTALLAVAQRTQKARQASSAAQPNVSVPCAPAQSAVPATPRSPTMNPASIAPPTAAPSQGQSNPASEQQPLLESSSRRSTAPRQSAPQANTPQPLASRSNAQGQAHMQSPASPGAFGTVFGAKDVAGVENLRAAHNLAERGSTLIATGEPNAPMHEDPCSAGHMVAGSAALADRKVQAPHQSSQRPHAPLVGGMECPVAPVVPGVPQPVAGSVGTGAHAYNLSTMHTQPGTVSASGSGVGNYAVGLASRQVTWEGHHNEHETEDLQRQLQQLADKESPVPVAIQPPMAIGMPPQQPHGLSRPPISAARDAKCMSRSESAGSGHSQPPMNPESERQTSEKVEPVSSSQGLAPVGCSDRMQVRVGAGAGSGGPRDVSQSIGPGDMLIECKPAREDSALLDMKDAFALDEVMDISPVQ